jgi:hypothetical protein
VPDPSSTSDRPLAPVARAGCWPGVALTSEEIYSARDRAATESPEYYFVEYVGVNDLMAQITALLDSQTWTAGVPPVLHTRPCLEVLELCSHGSEQRCGGVCQGNLADVAAAIEGLRYCDSLSIYLGGCHTGLRGGIAEELARLIPSPARARQYRCTVYGARGYLTGTYAGKDSRVTEDYTDTKGVLFPAHPGSANAHRDPSSAQDESFQGYRGPNSA